jgi:hypothetical protein
MLPAHVKPLTGSMRLSLFWTLLVAVFRMAALNTTLEFQGATVKKKGGQEDPDVASFITYRL